MTGSHSSPQQRLLRDQINAIIPNAYDQLENVASFDQELACRIVSLITQFCCAAQNMGSIVAGRNAFKKLPGNWLTVNIPSIISRAVNLKDAWEYRRFLELLREAKIELLHTYVASGLKSSDPEIQEAATDFAQQE